jgi:tRNA 5-methylaminomethyl-2-thiouridine biosynthesis bifunctional protein
VYDVVIIGAGINGSSVAFEMIRAKKKVLVLDMDGVAGGGSGAAGAFISPKFSKAGELKELIGDAFVYSMEFYEQNFSKFLTKAQLLHIAQDSNSGEILQHYKKNTHLDLKSLPSKVLDTLKPHAKSMQHISLDAGVVDAKATCQEMIKGAVFKKERVESLEYDDGLWVINETYSAKDVVLATGAYEQIIKEPYLKLRGVWGHRIDIKTTTKNLYSIHQEVSISPSKDGVLAIGATHNVHYHPQTSTKPYDVEEGRAELLQKASKTLNLENVEVIKDYMGLRSGSFDYIPIVGSLVLSSETMASKNIRFKTKKPLFDEYVYYPNLYMINGNGGYGFVLAPYLAKMLKDKILSDKKISDRLSPARFFARWAKKL